MHSGLLLSRGTNLGMYGRLPGEEEAGTLRLDMEILRYMFISRLSKRSPQASSSNDGKFENFTQHSVNG